MMCTYNYFGCPLLVLPPGEVVFIGRRQLPDGQGTCIIMYKVCIIGCCLIVLHCLLNTNLLEMYNQTNFRGGNMKGIATTPTCTLFYFKTEVRSLAA